jgi:hypothetical protein
VPPAAIAPYGPEEIRAWIDEAIAVAFERIASTLAARPPPAGTQTIGVAERTLIAEPDLLVRWGSSRSTLRRIADKGILTVVRLSPGPGAMRHYHLDQVRQVEAGSVKVRPGAPPQVPPPPPKLKRKTVAATGTPQSNHRANRSRPKLDGGVISSHHRHQQSDDQQEGER